MRINLSAKAIIDHAGLKPAANLRMGLVRRAAATRAERVNPVHRSVEAFRLLRKSNTRIVFLLASDVTFPLSSDLLPSWLVLSIPTDFRKFLNLAV